jgi:outer membrane receptor protein involved in Fe transport
MTENPLWGNTMKKTFNKSILSSAIHTVVVAAAMLPGAAVFAADDLMQEVLVTGSRISRPELSSVSPYTVVSGEEFKISGILNVEQKLNELPSTVPSFGPSSNNPGDGTARVDLRGLGSSRTLVLVNGRRYIPATQTGVVDLNSIPATLIKQVDVLTGGASAVYGSDALAGVVNFQLVDDFEGMEVTSLYDITSDGDAEKYNFDITIGGNFDEGRGNAVVYASYMSREALYQGSRDFTSVALQDRTVNGLPALVAGGSSGVPGTRVFGGPTLPNGDTLGIFDQNGEGRAFADPEDRFNYAPDNFLQLPQERYLFTAMSHYDVTDSVKVYSELNFSNNLVPQELAPTPAFQSVFVNPNSAFFGPNAQAAFNAVPAADLDADGNVPIYIGRRMVEVGSRQSIDSRNAFRVLVGASGDLSDTMSFDMSYSLSNLERTQQQNGNISRSRLIQAVAVTDSGLACQDTSNGCVPINIFGPGNISTAAADFIRIGATNLTSIRQEIIQASMSGEVFTLPSSSVPVSVVLGYEHRADDSNFRPDTALSSGDVSGFNAGRATTGAYKSSDIFGEVSMPIMQGKPGIEELTLWGAARYSVYSNIGEVASYAAAINYSPVDMVGFRIGYQEAVRAPNVSELFGGQSQGFPSASDPCAVQGFTAGTTDAALCAATGVDAAQVGVFNQANAQIQGQFGGNPNLREETSNTFTIGAVIQPMDGLDITVDYYDIEIEDAISVLGGSVANVLDLCYNVIKDAGSPFCQAVNRRADGNINQVNVLNANIGLIETSGIDLNVNYTTDVGFGIGGEGSVLSVVFNSTFLDTYDSTPVAELSGRVDNCAGNFGNTCGSPLNEVNWNTRATLTSGAWTVSGLLRFLGEVNDDRIENGPVGAGTLAAPTIDSIYYLDISASYEFNENARVTLGVQNLTDSLPEPVGSVAEQGNTFPSTYTMFGPRMFVSASYSL